MLLLLVATISSKFRSKRVQYTEHKLLVGRSGARERIGHLPSYGHPPSLVATHCLTGIHHLMATHRLMTTHCLMATNCLTLILKGKPLALNTMAACQVSFGTDLFMNLLWIPAFGRG